MTTKANAKTFKQTLTATQHSARGSLLAKLHLQGVSLTDSMQDIVKDEHAANTKEGRTCGTVRSGDEFMCTLQGKLIESGRYEEGSKALANLMSQVRKAVNTGSAFKHASSEKAAKESQAKKTRSARQSVGEKSVVKLTIVKDAQPYDVAQGLRESFNDAKFRDGYAELAAFLIDALDEFQGTES